MQKSLNLRKTVSLVTLLAFALLAFACSPAGNNTKPNTNANNTNTNTNTNNAVVTCDDAKVIKSIKDQVAASPTLAPIMSHLNAYSKGCSVSLMGYTETLANYKEFYNFAANTADVVSVNIDGLFIDGKDVSKPSGGQCPAGQQVCGDICVKAGQCWSSQLVDPKASPVPNSNSNTNSNKASKP